MRDWLDQHAGGHPIDLVVDGTTSATDTTAATDRVSLLAEAGATWWIETDWTTLGDVAALRARIDAGPPLA
jgi:hypothetical protein